MSQGQKGFGRVSQTNRHCKGYKRWQFILELPLPVFCSSARNRPAVVSNMLPETHFKGTSYCELVKGRLEGRPNISDIKYFHPPQTENYITLSPFTISSISTQFISYESLLEWNPFRCIVFHVQKEIYKSVSDTMSSSPLLVLRMSIS